jgi:outer membrane lipoprotein-sorting protein
LAPLLFPQAGLQGTLTEVATTTDEGFEIINGRRCHKLSGIAKSVYSQTGRETNVRRITVWIDAETMLVRKVFEDTPSGGPAGNVMRYTTTFEPQANPTLDDLKFRFVPPAQK